MSLSNGFDTRASSLVSDIDAAIERVVAHFEDNDIALRADVLRALATQAKLSFETERMRQRLRQHPLTRDLIDAISTQSTVFARLAAGLTVHEFSCEYDAQRNVEILATVRWLLEDDATARKQASKKKRKTQRSGSAADTKVDRSVPLILRYAYSRSLADETTTLVEFRVTSSVGESAKPKELVHFGMSSSAPYPRSYYEDVNDGNLSDSDMEGSDDEDGDEDGENESSATGASGKNKKTVAAGARRAPSQAVEASEDESEANDEDDAEDDDETHERDDDDDVSSDGATTSADPHGEAVEAFNFDETAVEDMLTWLNEGERVDPADVLGFFLALPVAEDEWQLDERITEIVFSAPSDDGSENGEEEEDDEAED